jgi:hypothetical protein
MQNSIAASHAYDNLRKERNHGEVWTIELNTDGTDSTDVTDESCQSDLFIRVIRRISVIRDCSLSSLYPVRFETRSDVRVCAQKNFRAETGFARKCATAKTADV